MNLSHDAGVICSGMLPVVPSSHGQGHRPPLHALFEWVGHHFFWSGLRGDLRTRLSHNIVAGNVENILCGPLFEDLPADQEEKVLVLREADETFRLFYKMVEEILTLKEIEERASAGIDDD